MKSKKTIRMKKLYLFCLFLGFFSVVQAETAFMIIPQPQKMECKKTVAWNHYELRQLVLSSGVERPVMGAMLDLLTLEGGKGKKLTLTLTEQGVPESEEGYTLSIEKSGAIIKARHTKGLFYGCQTLEQLMEDSRDFDQPIPCMYIEDYPAISYRAVHWDTKHHLNRMEYYYEMIDRLASYKINAVIWELEDKLRYTRRPEIAAGNAISKQEMQALSRYAMERNVEISPLVQGLGHAAFILKHHWELRENPLSDWEFCPTNPKTYELQFDLYRDALEALPHGRYLHVGGDEITAIGIDERCKATGKSPFELQMEWLGKVMDFAGSQGRTTIFWDDMPLKHGGVWHLTTAKLTEEEVSEKWSVNTLDESMELFPKSCIYMRWNYNDPTTLGHQRVLQWYKDSGLKVMAATGASCGDSPFLPRKDSRSHYIKSFCELTAENNLQGILATAWDDGSPHQETVWRGYIAHAEFAWHPSGRSVDEYLLAHSQREFGVDASRNYTRFITDLEETFFFFDGALVQSGRRNPAWGTTTFQLIDLPDKSNPGKWSEVYAEKINQARLEDLRYIEICEGLELIKKFAKRNRYVLDVYTQLNELQHFPSRLILALADYDQGTDIDSKQKALARIQTVCDSFSPMRASLEDVYSKIRFLEHPEGYVSETNHHNHLSIKTLNFDWMYYYEIPMIQKVSKWIKSL